MKTKPHGLLLTVDKDSDGPFCGNCPMLDGEYGTCNAAMLTGSDAVDVLTGSGNSPDWCPLRKGPITICTEKVAVIRSGDQPTKDEP